MVDLPTDTQNPLDKIKVLIDEVKSLSTEKNEIDDSKAFPHRMFSASFAAMGLTWSEGDTERLLVILEYATLNKEFRKKLLANPGKIFDETGIKLPKDFEIILRETDAPRELTLRLPRYVGPA
jgi:hypothetical protein